MRSCINWESPIGWLTLEEYNGELTRLAFGKQCLGGEDKESVFLLNVRRQLEEYFQGRRKIFELPLNPEGTVFQKRVWEELVKIPYGETKSYKEIAKRLGKPGACRAVGMANNRNPIAIIIPCHRVIGSGGTLVGYAGGLEIKKQLLKLESVSYKSV